MMRMCTYLRCREFLHNMSLGRLQALSKLQAFGVLMPNMFGITLEDLGFEKHLLT